MRTTDDPLPRVLGGRYRLESVVGRGEASAVYRAVDVGMRRPVAVKVLRAASTGRIDEATRERFLREAKHTAKVHHEHIVEVYDFGAEAEEMFLVMELLEGEHLGALLSRVGKLSLEDGTHVLRQVCMALGVAHAAGIVHRDLKPENVMLVRRARDERYVKVLDFGVAKAYGSERQADLTQRGELVGAVEFMAPEQISGKPVDGRADVYALGMLMHRLFTGACAFADAGVAGLVHAHVSLSPRSMRERAPEVPVALDRVAARCLAKKPEDRYASTTELSRALEEAVGATGADVGERMYAPGGYVGAAGEAVAAARPERAVFDDATVRGDQAPARVAFDDVTVRMDPAAAVRAAFDDATVRVDPAALASGATMSVEVEDLLSSNTAESIDSDALTAVMTRGEANELRGALAWYQDDAPSDELSTARRPPPARSGPPQPCAMCRTMNPAAAKACSACGVSLAPDEQAAVRARVAPSRPPAAFERGPDAAAPRGVAARDVRAAAPKPVERPSAKPGAQPATRAAAPPPGLFARLFGWLRG